MIGLIQSLLRRAWHLTCIASLAPLVLKSTDHDVGHWKTSKWSWGEAAAPAAAALLLEGTARCLWSRIKSSHKKRNSVSI